MEIIEIQEKRTRENEDDGEHPNKLRKTSDNQLVHSRNKHGAKPNQDFTKGKGCFYTYNIQKGFETTWKERVDFLKTLKTEDVMLHTGQVEKGEEGRIHAQGIIVFKTALGLNRVMEILGCPLKTEGPGKGRTRCWKEGTEMKLLTCRSIRHSIEYCQKLDTRLMNDPLSASWNLGSYETEKENFEELAKDLKTPIVDLFKLNVGKFAREYKGIEYGRRLMRDALLPKDRSNIKIRIWWGEPGIGKTTAAKKGADLDTLYQVKFQKGTNKWWWTDYDNNPTILVDDFHSNITLEDMLTFTDRNQSMRVSARVGEEVKMTTEDIRITSNYDPLTWYHGIKDTDPKRWLALMRRLAEPYVTIYHCTGKAFDLTKYKEEVQKIDYEKLAEQVNDKTRDRSWDVRNRDKENNQDYL